MIGKKNIVFGLFYLVLTASLGPFMVVNHFPDYLAAAGDSQSSSATLAQIRNNGYERDLEPVSGEELARLNTDAITAMNKMNLAHLPIDVTRGTHAHGNLEALLNIAAGLVLMFIAVPRMYKQAISWIFILGALFHSGTLFLRAFGLPGAGLAELPIGPPLVLLGLFSLGVAALMGLRNAPVEDATL